MNGLCCLKCHMIKLYQILMKYSWLGKTVLTILLVMFLSTGHNTQFPPAASKRCPLGAHKGGSPQKKECWEKRLVIHYLKIQNQDN